MEDERSIFLQLRSTSGYHVELTSVTSCCGAHRTKDFRRLDIFGSEILLLKQFDAEHHVVPFHSFLPWFYFSTIFFSHCFNSKRFVLFRKKLKLFTAFKFPVVWPPQVHDVFCFRFHFR